MYQKRQMPKITPFDYKLSELSWGHIVAALPGGVVVACPAGRHHQGHVPLVQAPRTLGDTRELPSVLHPHSADGQVHPTTALPHRVPGVTVACGSERDSCMGW